jgi:hypothetical protein
MPHFPSPHLPSLALPAFAASLAIFPPHWPSASCR